MVNLAPYSTDGRVLSDTLRTTDTTDFLYGDVLTWLVVRTMRSKRLLASIFREKFDWFIRH